MRIELEKVNGNGNAAPVGLALLEVENQAAIGNDLEIAHSRYACRAVCEGRRGELGATREAEESQQEHGLQRASDVRGQHVGANGH